MSDFATKQDVEGIVNKAVDGLAEIISDFATNVDQRFDAVDQRFEDIDKRLEGVDKRFEGVDKRFEGIDKRFDKIESRLDRQSTQITELQVSNAQIISRLDDIDGRLMAVENDIKDIYFMLASKQDKKPLQKLKGKTLEQYILETYKNIVTIAKQEGIKLPK